MDTLFDYGLTPRSLAAIAFGISAMALAMWGAYQWRAQRERE
jgi:hypothetical protein